MGPVNPTNRLSLFHPAASSQSPVASVFVPPFPSQLRFENKSRLRLWALDDPSRNERRSDEDSKGDHDAPWRIILFRVAPQGDGNRSAEDQYYQSEDDIPPNDPVLHAWPPVTSAGSITDRRSGVFTAQSAVGED